MHLLPLLGELLGFFDGLVLLGDDLPFLLKELVVERGLLHPLLIVDVVLPVLPEVVLSGVFLAIDAFGNFGLGGVPGLPALRFGGMVFGLVLQFLLLDLLLIMLHNLFEVDLCLFLLRSLI